MRDECSKGRAAGANAPSLDATRIRNEPSDPRRADPRGAAFRHRRSRASKRVRGDDEERLHALRRLRDRRRARAEHADRRAIPARRGRRSDGFRRRQPVRAGLDARTAPRRQASVAARALSLLDRGASHRRRRARAGRTDGDGTTSTRCPPSCGTIRLSPTGAAPNAIRAEMGGNGRRRSARWPSAETPVRPEWRSAARIRSPPVR